MSFHYSVSLTQEEAEFFQMESLCLMCLRYPAGQDGEGQEHQPGSVPQRETSPEACGPGGKGTPFPLGAFAGSRHLLVSLHPEPEILRSGLVLPVQK